MNKEGLEMTGVTQEDYLRWCKRYKKPNYKPETKRRFFKLIKNGEITRDSEGNLIIR